ncbi:hypothetical protein [Polycladidibacter hongkongensis]|uniref:hypothetical protein n=1 Tax=Polycladidibacter hongkongensis TaxID=1647556 RepID=UPI00082C7CA1|nr:hypothetical protein [Pseudovibrio hongkongensis]
MQKNKYVSASTQQMRREAIIAEAIRPVAAELRMVDLTSLARHILANETANMDDLIASSVELFFKPDTLTYASTSTIELNWSGETSVNLHLRFAHNGVIILFQLILLPLNSAVEVKYIAFDTPSDDAEENTVVLQQALTDAQLKL